MILSVVIGIIIFSFLGYFSGRARALRLADENIEKLHSLPCHYGFFVSLWIFVPSMLFVLAWSLFFPRFLDSRVLHLFSKYVATMSSFQVEAFLRDVQILSAGGELSVTSRLLTAASRTYSHYHWMSQVFLTILVMALCVLCFVFALRSIKLRMRARAHVELFIRIMLMCSSAMVVLTTIGIVLSLIVESWHFFNIVPLTEFLFGLHWNPQLVVHAGQEVGTGVFGIVPLFVGTILITLITMCVAAPIGLMSAIYLSDYASPGCRMFAKPLLEILAGVPTVVYGFFAALIIAPLFRNWGLMLGLGISAESALAAGLVMGIMIIPFISSLSDDVICAVPQSMRDGSSALGATKSETIIKVVLPAAMPGIVSAMLLAISRAIGETMIVVMAAGMAANLTFNPLNAVTSVTVQIVTLLSGDQEFDNPKTLAAFALSLVLCLVTLILNIIAWRVIRKYRKRYD